jgi:uncharacterized hydrophobic protein (TIGR00341 family)
VPLRLIEVVVPRSRGEELEALAEDHPIIDLWREEVDADHLRLRLLVDAGAAEPVMDELERRFGDQERFRLLLMPVQASLPRPEEPEPEEEAEDGAEEDDETASSSRISREELYADLSDSAEMDQVFLIMTALSALVCSAGLLMDDVAVVIGAMVIAPILGPLVALALATTLADGALGKEALKAAGGGLALAFLVSLCIGAVAPVSPDVPAIAARSSVGLGHVGLALAAGAAGTLAFTTGTAEAVIGVMVAVALVPPLVATGLLLGGGHSAAAQGSFLLTGANLIGVNLAGVLTFLLQGVQPNRWWEAERAKRSTAVAVAVWTVLLLALVAAILWGPGAAR